MTNRTTPMVALALLLATALSIPSTAAAPRPACVDDLRESLNTEEWINADINALPESCQDALPEQKECPPGQIPVGKTCLTQPTVEECPKGTVGLAGTCLAIPKAEPCGEGTGYVVHSGRDYNLCTDLENCEEGEVGVVSGGIRACRDVASLPGPGETEGVSLLCLNQGCVGTSCSGSTADCEAGAKKCHGWQSWGVEGSHEGSGKVRFWVECGSGIPAVCETVDLPECHDGPESGSGKLGCFHEIVEGDVSGIIGKCFDPLNPQFVYESIPAGLPYDANEHLIRI